MATTQQQQKNYTPIVLGVLAVFFYDKIFGKDPDEKKEEKEEQKFIDQPVDINPLATGTYSIAADVKARKFKVPTGYKAIGGVTGAQIGSISKQIFDGIGTIYNDNSKLQGAFKQIPSRAAVWAIAKYYNEKYKRDLLFDLKNSRQSNSVMIYEYINKLPVGVLVKK